MRIPLASRCVGKNIDSEYMNAFVAGFYSVTLIGCEPSVHTYARTYVSDGRPTSPRNGMLTYTDFADDGWHQCLSTRETQSTAS